MGLLQYISPIFVSVIFLVSTLSECGPLNDYILDYQPLVYDRNAVHTNHLRVRRSADSHVHIRFSAFGRDFKLKLSPTQGIFSHDHQLFTTDRGPRTVDTSFIYQGVVQDVHGSTVHMSIRNGSIEGEVNMADTTYHIEPATKYIDNPNFHTIIYPEKHLNVDPYRVRRAAESSTCGVDHVDVHDFMEKASRLAEPLSSYRSKRETTVEEGPHNIYTEYSNRDKRSARQKRQTTGVGAKNTCPLHMRADKILFDFFKLKKHGIGRQLTDQEAEEEIMAFFANHVSAITSIYKNTVFQTYDQKKINPGVGFAIHRSTVMKTCNSVDPGYCSNTLDVSNFLDLTSRENHDLFCLTFTFTYRDFSGGTLGLAWVATEGNIQSGICGKFSTFTGGVKKSLNTGIVTIINYGKTVPNKVSQLTFAHEVGHNFGSPHDEGSPECAPFGTKQPDANNGNYIMFPSATSGNLRNNDQFSKCSKDNMTRIIQQVVDRVRGDSCFVESNQSFCGNQITEAGEACDCGFGSCASDTCCVGRDDDKNIPGCTVTARSVCSPDSGPCCQKNCTYLPEINNITCQEATECQLRSACNGTTFRCPAAVTQPDGTFCSSYTKVCSRGECIGSVCSKIGWNNCFISNVENQLCYVACSKNGTGDCISSLDTVARSKPENKVFYDLLLEASRGRTQQIASSSIQPVALPPGSPCDNYRGYCDTFSKCQRIDADGPFNQLTNMIFSPVTFKIIEDWIVVHWWAVLLMCIGLVVFLGVFIKVFGYNTPSEDPKRSAARGQRRQPPRGGGGGGANARHGVQSSAPPKQETPSAPPPYSTDMGHYPGYLPQPSNRVNPASQYDRVAPAGKKYHY